MYLYVLLQHSTTNHYYYYYYLLLLLAIMDGLPADGSTIIVETELSLAALVAQALHEAGAADEGHVAVQNFIRFGLIVLGLNGREAELRRTGAFNNLLSFDQSLYTEHGGGALALARGSGRVELTCDPFYIKVHYLTLAGCVFSRCLSSLDDGWTRAVSQRRSLQHRRSPRIVAVAGADDGYCHSSRYFKFHGRCTDITDDLSVRSLKGNCSDLNGKRRNHD